MPDLVIAEQHGHVWTPVGPLGRAAGYPIGFDVCSCYAVRGTVADEEYVFPPIGVFTPVTAAALGTIIGAWAFATIRRKGLS